jgi:hypothetical protein
MGEKPSIERCIQESYLHQILDSIIEKNNHLFVGKLKPGAIRFEYDPQIEKTAKIDLQSIVITVSNKFFQKLKNDGQVAAIICHEVSHIIRGHTQFEQPPHIIQKYPKFIKYQKLVDKARKNLELEKASSIFKNFDNCYGELLAYFMKLHPQTINKIKKKLDSNKENNVHNFRKIMIKQLEIFAKNHNSKESTNYLKALQSEREYQVKMKEWKKVLDKQSDIIDEFLGEKGASKNWKEQEADELGFRMFIRAGYNPIDFLRAIVQTFDNETGELKKYLEKIINIEDPTAFKFPPREYKDHPTPKWRMANLAIREIRLRYPQEYKKMMKEAKKMPTKNSFV